MLHWLTHLTQSSCFFTAKTRRTPRTFFSSRRKKSLRDLCRLAPGSGREPAGVPRFGLRREKGLNETPLFLGEIHFLIIN